MYAMIMVLWIRYYKKTKIMKTLKYFENYWRFTKMCVRKKWQVFWVKLIGDLEFFFVIFAKWSILMQEIQKLRKCDKSLLVFWGLLNSETPTRVLKLNFQFSFFIWKVSNRKKNPYKKYLVFNTESISTQTYRVPLEKQNFPAVWPWWDPLRNFLR